MQPIDGLFRLHGTSGTAGTDLGYQQLGSFRVVPAVSHKAKHEGSEALLYAPM
jgi:hypothetical protein